MSEALVKEKTCVRCKARFPIRAADIAFYKKVEVPEPTHCTDCRELRRLLFQNERHLYRRKCSASGKELITYFHPDIPVKVYDNPIWWGDSWDAKSYGREFDFSKPFFKQFGELLQDVPYANLFNDYTRDENSEYTNYAGGNKNCYLIAHADTSQDCLYGYGVKQCDSVVDSYNVVKCQFCYECTDCYGCYDLHHSQDCMNCSESLLLRDCVGCKHCIGCQNLRQKEYCVFNEQLTKAQYESFALKYRDGRYSAIQSLISKFEAQRLQTPHRGIHELKCEGSFGDQLINCKNVISSYEISDAEDLRYCTQLKSGTKDSMDVHQFGSNAELLYECSVCGTDAQRLRFCSGCVGGVSELTYCSGCFTSSNLFGCVNMKRAKHCILNKQYSPTEYEALQSRIIQHMKDTGEWGEFFPTEIALFAYNETRAQDFYPLTAEAARANGFTWREDSAKELKGIDSGKIPDSITEFNDAHQKAVYLCKNSGKPFKITAQELTFYRNAKIPAPRLSPDERHRQRILRKNPRRLWTRPCSRCKEDMPTSYAPERREIVYCERCYEEEALDRMK